MMKNASYTLMQADEFRKDIGSSLEKMFWHDSINWKDRYSFHKKNKEISSAVLSYCESSDDRMNLTRTLDPLSQSIPICILII
jgi:hypothetical protein